jgi:hypothetical protein
MDIPLSINQFVENKLSKKYSNYEALLKEAQILVNNWYPGKFPYDIHPNLSKYLNNYITYSNNIPFNESKEILRISLYYLLDNIRSFQKNINTYEKEEKEKKIENFTQELNQFLTKLTVNDKNPIYTEDFKDFIDYLTGNFINYSEDSSIYKKDYSLFFYFNYSSFFYFNEKIEALNWTVFINYLSNNNNQALDTDLYNEGITIFHDFISENLNKQLNTESLSYSRSLPSQKLIIDVDSNPDMKMLDEFFKQLYNQIFTKKKHHNPLDLYSQNILNIKRDSFVYDGPCDAFNINTHMNYAASLFNITYTILTQTPEKIELEITCLETQNTILLNIFHEKDVCFVTSYRNKDLWIITIDPKYSLSSFLHEFAHIYHHWKSDLNFSVYMNNYMAEIYPMYVEDLCEHNDKCFRMTWNSLITAVFLHSLEPYLADEAIFKTQYIHSFSLEHQKLLKILEEKDSDFYKKIRNSVIKNIEKINDLKWIKYFLGTIFKAYCIQNNLTDHEAILKNSSSFSQMLRYLNLTPEKLATYTYSYFYKNLRTF